MKICWDNLEKIKFENGKFKNNHGMVLFYINNCNNCGEPFLAFRTSKLKDFCSNKCRNIKNNPMKGKKYNKE